MKQALEIEWMAAEQDQRITDAIRKERDRLARFIRKRVADSADAEDVLQDVFSELVEAERLAQPVEQVSAWLYRVARNRITDLFRKKKPDPLPVVRTSEDEADEVPFADLLPSPDAGPEAVYARAVLLDELEAALDELPDEQSAVFVAHEWEGRSFKELAAETGVSVNTLLSRKHAAVLHLRRRLQRLYQELEEMERNR
jgi:RNA polymerase sigma factor (sigma-70 family)